MEIDNIRHEESNDAPVIRLNKAKRDELEVKVGDKVLIKKVRVEVVEAEVHQALRGEIDETVLVGGQFEESEPKLEIVLPETESETETEDEEYEDE